MPAKPILTVDGSRFDNLDGFMDEVSRLLEPGVYWGRNLERAQRRGGPA